MSYDDWYIYEETNNYYEINIYVYPVVRLEID